jgi:hypothetical protein
MLVYKKATIPPLFERKVGNFLFETSASSDFFPMGSSALESAVRCGLRPPRPRWRGLDLFFEAVAKAGLSEQVKTKWDECVHT